MELDARSVIDGIRGVPDVIEGQVGLIDADVAKTASGVPYVYSIVKIRLEPVGVEYNLTLHFPGEHPVQLQGRFRRGQPHRREGCGWSTKWPGATTWWGRRPRMIQAAAARPLRSLNDRLRDEHE